MGNPLGYVDYLARFDLASLACDSKSGFAFHKINQLLYIMTMVLFRTSLSFDIQHHHLLTDDESALSTRHLLRLNCFKIVEILHPFTPLGFRLELILRLFTYQASIARSPQDLPCNRIPIIPRILPNCFDHCRV